MGLAIYIYIYGVSPNGREVCTFPVSSHIDGKKISICMGDIAWTDLQESSTESG